MEKKKVNRRDFLRLASFTAAGAVLASCTPAAQPTAAPVAGATEAPAATKAPAAAVEKVTIRQWHWDSFILDGFKAVGDNYTKKNPNVTVSVELNSWGEYSQKVAASIAGGTPPDVCGVIAEHFTNLASQDQLVDMKPFIDKTSFPIQDYHPGNLSQNTWGGKLLSIPYTADGMWLWYNADEFKKQNLKTPYEYWKDGKWNRDTVMELAKQLTSGEGVTKNFGYGGFDYGNYFDILPAEVSNGGTGLFDEKYTACQLTDPKMIELYKWGYEMRKYSPGPEEQATSNPASGRVMMWMDWSCMGPSYSTNYPFKFSYAPPIPSPAGQKLVFVGDAPGFGILTGVKNQELAWDYISFLNTPESGEVVFDSCGQEPPRMSVATDPKLWERNTKFPDSAIAHELTVERFKDGFYNTPKVSNFAEMWQAYNEELSLAWVDKQPLEDAMKKANDRINGLLKDATIDQDRLYWTS